MTLKTAIENNKGKTIAVPFFAIGATLATLGALAYLGQLTFNIPNKDAATFFLIGGLAAIVIGFGVAALVKGQEVENEVQTVKETANAAKTTINNTLDALGASIDFTADGANSRPLALPQGKTFLKNAEVIKTGYSVTEGPYVVQ